LSATGTYIVTVQIDPGCNGPKAADTVQAGTVPMSINNVQDVTCFGLSNGSATAVVNGGNPPIQYTWSTTPVQNTATATGLSAGTYSCIVSDADGCTDTLTVTITQPAALTGTISGTSLQCTGASNTLSITPGGGTPLYTVTWNPGGGSGNSITINPDSTTTYTATITDQNGCTRIDSFLVNVLQIGTVGLTASSGGCAPWTVNFTDQTLPPVNGAITGWLWDFGDGNTSTAQNPSHQYTTPGNYTVTLVVTFTGGCTATATLPNPVSIFVTPQANFSVSNLGAGEFAFTDLSTNAVSWNWNFGDGGFSGEPNPQHMFDILAADSVPVTLIATSANGCADTITLPVDIRDFALYIPNSFTPNSNGFNDGFTAQGVGIKSFELWIFDRWGMLLYHCTDIHQPWDGTFKGHPVQMDTYVYKITAGDVYGNTHDYIGGVSVVR
jgi:gliding motility-associated-like protein